MNGVFYFDGTCGSVIPELRKVKRVSEVEVEKESK